jgi:hypothetical protein
MLLSFSERRRAIIYNHRRGYDTELVSRMQRLVGADDDGIIGPRTVEAVALWQQRADLTADGKIGPKTLAEMESAWSGTGTSPEDATTPPSFLVEPDPQLTPILEDRIAAGHKALRRKSKDTNQRYQGKPRAAARVNGIALHQMAFSRGDDIEKYDKVTAHYVITPDGGLAQLHDLTIQLWSSNHLNGFTVAVEFAGNLRSAKGRWHGTRAPDVLTPQQVAAGRFLLQHMRDTYGIKKAYAHIQGRGAGRANCCGPEIWKSVAQWAIDPGGLGFQDTTHETYGPGWPIPDTWK